MTLPIMLGFPVQDSVQLTHWFLCVIMVLPAWIIKIQISIAFMAPTDIGILSLLFIVWQH